MSGYKYKMAFGCWINDMRNVAMPDKDWPCWDFDEQTEKDIIKCMDVQSIAGFNTFNCAGLFATNMWELDIASTVNTDRRDRVLRVISAAHERNLKILSVLGVYSWGFDKIIASDPEVQGTNPHAMCFSSDASWEWMRKVIDYHLDNYEIDGFHLEASDQGRCSCPECAAMSDTRYYSEVNARCADYIRSRKPDAILVVNMCGYTNWGETIKDEDVKYLIELGGHLDGLIDPGHKFGFFLKGKERERIFNELGCAFGSSGGFWNYTPQRWDRLRWFLPYVQRTGGHLKELYSQSGRAVEYYMGPVINPGCEVNIMFGGRIMSDPDREIRDVLSEVIEILYRPETKIACDELTDLFLRAENAYFNSFIPGYPNQMGEWYLEPLFGTEPGYPGYLERCLGQEPERLMIDDSGRQSYKIELQAILQQLPDLKTKVGEKEKIDRIETCILNVIKDIDSFNLQ
ncbi:MAG: hypothetical protein ACYCYI_05200 [Saccharofermentanales bacterium]